jgi:predicted transcriptional regulator
MQRVAAARQLGQLEAVIMERLWSWERPVAVREVLDDLRRDRPIAYTTVMTVMNNLHRKGLLTREMHGRAYRYQPARSREEHHAELMGQVLAGSGDRAATLMLLVEQMPPDEVARLRAALAEGAPQDRRRRV